MVLLTLFALSVFCYGQENCQKPKCISGIYPKLSYYNQEGECGTGAVVPWAGSLWVITYGPHLPFGSSDKLYQITPNLTEYIRPESVGGTPANRMIHKESNQLFIGPYVIDPKGFVRVIPVTVMPGRLTGIARDLSDPVNNVLIATMEEGFYRVNVHNLAVQTLYEDGNLLPESHRENKYGPGNDLLPGVHGKGYYSGQGVAVFSDNGEDTQEALLKFDVVSGSLDEWDGKNWKVIRRNQFTEITGPGGIYGNPNPATDPIWALGWDYKSLLIGVRDVKRGWKFVRAPKASNSYDGAHGWNTEWPRIRNVKGYDSQQYLMTMHGMFWNFPKTFSWDNTAGLRPMTNYLKVVGDFCSWNGRLVFGCDDSAKSEFLNTRKAKGDIAGPGQSQSNLWFTSEDRPANNGTSDAIGSVWQREKVKEGTVSDPFLFGGWKKRTAWISNDGDKAAKYTFEIDKNGNNKWSTLKIITINAHSSTYVSMDNEQGEWIRVKVNKNTLTTVAFVYGDTHDRSTSNNIKFAGLCSVNEKHTLGGQMLSLGHDRKSLGILTNESDNGNITETGYYELDGNMNIIKRDKDTTANFIRKYMAIPSKVVYVDKGSYILVDDKGRRWRFPLGNARYSNLMEKQALRICREVSTERDLFNLGGTFYELPAENADGYAKVRPVSTHNLQINDYCSFRGMLVMTGLDSTTVNEEHIYTSADGKCRVWAGAIDDLWSLGKPVGHGGPWIDTNVKKGEWSDPYLLSHYENKTLTLSHNSNKAVTFTVECDPTGDGIWMKYATYKVQPGEKLVNILPAKYIARWIRFSIDTDCDVTTWLEYK